jgi:hypothetical protein
MPRKDNHFWRLAAGLEIPPAGDVEIREPKEGWSRVAYKAVVRANFAVCGAYPRTARLHPSTVHGVAPAERVFPLWWPVSEVRRHYAPSRIILSDDAPTQSE